MYTEKDIREWLNESSGFYSISVLSECGSTNSRVMEAAKKGVPEGAVILTDIQTGGKGRRGRQFFSPPGSGVYVSILLRPALEAADVMRITALAAVAAARAVESVCGVSPGIKWVNDLYLRERKICGILAEAVTGESGRIEAVVLGTGINMFLPLGGFPDDIRNKAGTVLEREPGGNSDQIRAETAGAFLEEFFRIYRELPASDYMQEYRDRSILTGRTVTVAPDGEAYAAVVQGIDDEGRLVVRREDGEIRKLFAEEVSLQL